VMESTMATSGYVFTRNKKHRPKVIAKLPV